MLVSPRNWYTEKGVTPTLVGTDAGSALQAAALAAPWRGVPTRSGKIGTAIGYGAAGFEVTWASAVPIRSVGVIGVSGTLACRWTVRNGGSGGTLLAQVTADASGVFADTGADYALTLSRDLGATYTGDYVLLEWYRSGASTPFDLLGLWAGPALELNEQTMTHALRPTAVVEHGLTGADYVTDGRVIRRCSGSGVVDSAVFDPANQDDSLESWAELFALAGRTSPVLARFGGAGGPTSAYTYTRTLHGRLQPGSGIEHLSGPQHRVTIDVEEF